ncbi:MAG TPA: hypothetical protein VLL97_03775, partial [Acidobacteriota bacterium]|nr:hypothetical protein [Acidobacteriota bacterium]
PDGRYTESGTATVAGGILIMRERRPNRAPRFDYSSRGAYFITTNVKHRAEWFGRMQGGRMVLNADGLIAHRCWMEIPEHFPGVRVDAFVVMPDHVNGIIIIDDAPFPGDGRPNHAIIPVVVGSYKSAVSKLIHRFGSPSFQWQRSYHDTVIRDHHALRGVRRYIGENSVRRGGDRMVNV